MVAVSEKSDVLGKAPTEKPEVSAAAPALSAGGGSSPDASRLVRELSTPTVPPFKDNELETIAQAVNLSPAFRKLFNDVELDTVDDIANMASTADGFKEAAKEIFGEGLGDTAGKRALNAVKLVAFWKACNRQESTDEAMRLRLRAEPHLVPEMEDEQYERMRRQYWDRHALEVRDDAREPHKRLLDRIKRDLLLQKVLPAYRLHEVRTRDESIVQHAALGKTAEDLLKTAQVIDWYSPILTAEVATKRVHAFYVALEMTGCCVLDKFEVKREGGEVQSVTGGPLTWLQKLADESLKLPEDTRLFFVMLVDKAFREGIHQKLSRREAADYSRALHDLYFYEPHLWSDARTEARDLAGRRGNKRDFQTAFDNPNDRVPALMAPERSLQLAPLEPPGLSKTAKKKLRLAQQRQLALMDMPDRTPPPPPAMKGDKNKPGKGKGAGKGGKIPKDEWNRLTAFKDPKICRFYNAKAGCAVRSCPRSHVCFKCGQPHPLHQCTRR